MAISLFRSMNVNLKYVLCLCVVVFFVSCQKKTSQTGRLVVAEAKGKYLYIDDVRQIVPPGSSPTDSAEIADKYIQRWATDILMYEKAKQNISDFTEIDRLVEDYRKTLTIHQYQQGLLKKQKASKPTEQSMQEFYEVFKDQMPLKENIVKGFLLTVPNDAPNMDNVLKWVKKGDQEAIAEIEKYSLVNAISFYVFRENWVPFSQILQKAPFLSVNPSRLISTNNVIEENDSTHHYFLRIDEYRIIGQQEPYDYAHDKIMNVLVTRQNNEALSKIESELYNDAVRKQEVRLYPVE